MGNGTNGSKPSIVIYLAGLLVLLGAIWWFNWDIIKTVKETCGPGGYCPFINVAVNSALPPNTIQINPYSHNVPNNPTPLCTMGGNKCSPAALSPTYKCQTGTTNKCYDTWNAQTGACQCQCLINGL
jgi:hypothetical protein